MNEDQLTLADADLSRWPIIARATSEKHGSTNWTVLTIYRWDGVPVEGNAVVAEIVGETRQEGQVRRVRRAVFPTVAKALAWNMFDDRSALYQELRQRVLDAVDDTSRKPPVQRSGFDGQGGLLGGIMWLYEGIVPDGDDRAAVDAFADDFGVDRASVGAAIFAYGIGYNRAAGIDLVAWKAFVGSLAFFDREAFRANRETRRD